MEAAMTTANKPDADEDKNQKAAPESKEEKVDVYKRLNAFRPPESLLKKHPCKDCFNCLWCSDARCEVCLRSKGCGKCGQTPSEKPEEQKP